MELTRRWPGEERLGGDGAGAFIFLENDRVPCRVARPTKFYWRMNSGRQMCWVTELAKNDPGAAGFMPTAQDRRSGPTHHSGYKMSFSARHRH